MEYIILWVLALFGLWNIISKIVESTYVENRRGEVEVTIKVKNQENTIEYLIRELEKISLVGKINVIDVNSTDETRNIIKQLEEKYSTVKLI